MSDVAVPKAFVSHASEDKELYAEPLSRLLRERGVDAWFDRWELQPGDRLVQKIFEEGLGKSGAVIVLLSPTSVSKPWVQAEFENAVARHIVGEIRVIPVVVEPCTVPQSMLALLWIDLKSKGSLEAVAEEIAHTLHGKSDKPPVGKTPVYPTSSVIHLNGAEAIDSLVLELVFKAAMVHGRILIQHPDIEPFAAEAGVSMEQVRESTDILCEMGYLEQKNSGISRRGIIVNLPAGLLLGIAKDFGEPVLEYQKTIAGLIINQHIHDASEMEKQSGYKAPIVEAVLSVFEENGLCKISGPSRNISVYAISPRLTRWLNSA